MVWSSLALKWPITVLFCEMDHQKSNFSLKLAMFLSEAVYVTFLKTGCNSWKYPISGFQNHLIINKYSKNKLLYFVNWCSSELSKKGKNLNFQVNFLSQKSLSFLIFFSLKNVNFGEHFLIFPFFDNFLKWWPNFDN